MRGLSLMMTRLARRASHSLEGSASRLSSNGSALGLEILTLWAAVGLTVLALLDYAGAVRLHDAFLGGAVAFLVAFVLRMGSKGSLLRLTRSPGLLFLLGLLACNCGYTLRELVGLPRALDNYLESVIFGPTLRFQHIALVIGVIGIGGFVTGWSLGGLASRRKRRFCTQEWNECDQMSPWFAWSCIVMYLVFVVEATRLGKWQAFYGEPNSNSAILLAAQQFALTSLVAYSAHMGKSVRRRVVWVCLTVLVYGTVALFGWRGHSLAFVGAALVLLAWRINRVAWKSCAVAYLVLAIAWPIVGSTRGVSLAQRDYGAAFGSLVEEEGTQHFLAHLMYPLDLATSQEISLRYTVRFVQERGVGNGRWYPTSLGYAIPNLLGRERRDASEGQKAIASLVSETYVGTHGIGFTPIAEAYANFGIPGPYLVLLAVGFLLRRLQTWLVTRPSNERLAVTGIVAAGCFWWLRNDSMQLGRYILWGLAFYWLVRLMATIMGAMKKHLFAEIGRPRNSGRISRASSA